MDEKPAIVTRFAPSPSGRLHLGHAYSALKAWDFASENSGEFLLRIEDIDTNRCKAEFEEQIKSDLAWLGMQWPEPVRKQSEHLSDFQKISDKLADLGVLYPCFCTRKEIQAEIARAGAAPHGSEGPVYPGICSSLSERERRSMISDGKDFALRLDLKAALDLVGRKLVWQDLERGEIKISNRHWAALGDVVLVRKDIGTSYHIAVVTDDALQGVTHIVRGQDLFESTHIHVLLQRLLELPQPVYWHHKLIVDEEGKRLAKRDESETIASLREKGVSPEEIRARLGDC